MIVRIAQKYRTLSVIAVEPLTLRIRGKPATVGIVTEESRNAKFLVHSTSKFLGIALRENLEFDVSAAFLAISFRLT